MDPLALYSKDSRALSEAIFEGSVYREQFSVDLSDYGRETTFNASFVGITGKKAGLGADRPTATKSDYSGFIGIAPWTANEELKEYNLLY